MLTLTWILDQNTQHISVNYYAKHTFFTTYNSQILKNVTLLDKINPHWFAIPSTTWWLLTTAFTGDMDNRACTKEIQLPTSLSISCSILTFLGKEVVLFILASCPIKHKNLTAFVGWFAGWLQNYDYGPRQRNNYLLHSIRAALGPTQTPTKWVSGCVSTSI